MPTVHWLRNGQGHARIVAIVGSTRGAGHGGRWACQYDDHGGGGGGGTFAVDRGAGSTPSCCDGGWGDVGVVGCQGED